MHHFAWLHLFLDVLAVFQLCQAQLEGFLKVQPELGF